MKFNQKAQQVIEYLLIMAAVVAGVLGIAGPSGPMRNAVEKSLNKAVETIYQGYTWRVGTPGTCSVPCGIGEATRSVFCQREDGVTVADAYCESASGQTRVSLETVACNPANCGSYAWIGSGFGACSALCGGGTQTQTVVCRDSGGATVADTFCASAGPKPVSQPCNTQPCFVWQSGGACITTCSEVCGVGSCLQDVSCKDNVTGAKTADGNCPGTKPPTSFSCNTSLTCGFQWQVSTWSACDKACGGGTKTRTVQCVRQSDGAVVIDTNCDAGSEPASSGTCNTASCYHWELTSSWGPCSEVCGPGTQEIIVQCKDSFGNLLADTQCDIATKPSSTRACPFQPSCGYSWGSGTFGACSVTCGTGTQTRTVFCTRTFDSTNVDVSFCQATDPGGEPAASQPCNDTTSCCGNGACDNLSAIGYVELCSTCSSDCGVCATCSDGIQNQGETGVDCGGPCQICATCSDGIQNQGETGVDCGGPCAACSIYSCTGTPVNNTTLCPGSDVGLTSNIPYRFWSGCLSGIKCLTVCSPGYYFYNSTSCRTNRCRNAPIGASLCGNGQNTNVPTHKHNYSGPLAASCDGVTKCQSTCQGAYTFNGGTCYVDYEWRTASCGACSAFCGGGSQVCTYACYQKSTNSPVGSTECTNRGIVAPPVNQNCNNISCCGAGYIPAPTYGSYPLFGSGSYVASTATAYCQSRGCTGNNGYTVTTAGGPFPCEFGYVTSPLVIGNINCSANSWCGICWPAPYWAGFLYKMNSVSCY